MLGEILSPETCAACRICCAFDATDLWELPVLPEETAEAVCRLDAAVSFAEKAGEVVFAAPALPDRELFRCPMLGETGCIMGAEKPFDCRVWPFRLMRDADESVRITVAEYCPGLKPYTTEQLQAFLEKGLGEQMLAYAEQHPSHVHPMAENYRIVL